ncbi:MAG: hypothetical protein K2X45_10540 [Phreatobacter sp.]|nr:hypothetical protein [Phreatobacter sp.]
MLAHILNSLCLRVLGSPTFGRIVRAVVSHALRDVSPYGEAADSKVGTMAPVR